jgi:hypothetical protein
VQELNGWLMAELADLSAAAECRVNRDLAHRCWEALGVTLAFVIHLRAASESEDDHLLNDVVDDLDATIAASLQERTTRPHELTAGLRRLLEHASGLDAASIADSEHFADLLVAAANATVLTA